MPRKKTILCRVTVNITDAKVGDHVRVPFPFDPWIKARYLDNGILVPLEPIPALPEEPPEPAAAPAQAEATGPEEAAEGAESVETGEPSPEVPEGLLGAPVPSGD